MKVLKNKKEVIFYVLKSKVIPVVFSFLISILILVGFNYYCKLKIEKIGIVFNPNWEPVNSELTQYVVPNKNLENIPVSDEGNSDLPVFGIKDDSEKLGPVHEPNKRYRSAVKLMNKNQYLYDTMVEFDKNNRRIVKQTHSDKNEIAILFLGCSLTYGEGVNDFETFVSRISENIVGANVYNLGVGGSTETQIFYEMNNEKKDFYKMFKEKKLIIINTFFNSHLLRQACDYSCYGYNKWILSKPKYILNSEDKLEFKGFFKDFYSINFVTNLIFESSIFLYFNFQQHYIYEEKNLNLFVRTLEEIRAEYAKNYQVLQFYNYFHEYSNPDTINQLAPKVLQKNFSPIISNKDYIRETFKRSHVIPVDGHPNATGHQIDAATILWALKRDWPNLIKNNKVTHL